MKQVTIAGVKDFINEIEKGGLSLREEYVLACLRELVAVNEQRDAVVAENAVLIDLARTFADRADDYKGSLMGFSVFESFNELKSAGSKEATSSAIAALRAEARSSFVDDAVAAISDSGALTVGDCVVAVCQLRDSKGVNHG